MSIIDQLLSVLAPYECLGCTAESNLLCSGCIQQLSPVPERCYRCLTGSLDSLTCGTCRLTSQLHQVRAGTIYAGIPKGLIWQLKSAGAQAATRTIARIMVPKLTTSVGSIIVPVPTATSRVRQRGYDQAKLLARELSRQTGLPYLDCLVRSGQTHQVGASRSERLGQLDGAFRLRYSKSIQRAVIILVDDVMTTGATLETAAVALQAAGVKRVEAIVFAVAERRNTPSIK